MQPKPGIHIINSHYVTPEKVNFKGDALIFEEFLVIISKIGNLISLEEATKRINDNEIPKNEVLIALSFDDGFEECYTIIAPLLEKYNCRGAFFINGNYVNSTLEYKQKFNQRIATYTKDPMNWEQIMDLHNRGHLIGAHTLDHLNMANLNDEDLHYQLATNKEILETKLSYKCEYFAWPYGQLKHFPETALETTRLYHPYIYSGTNYRSYFSMNGRVLNRRHMEPFWPKSYIKYFLSCKKK